MLVLIALNKTEILYWRKSASPCQSQWCNVALYSLSIWPSSKTLWMKIVECQELAGLILSVIKLTALLAFVSALAMLLHFCRLENQTFFFECLPWHSRIVSMWHKMTIKSFIKLLKMSPGETEDPVQGCVASAALLRLCCPRAVQREWKITVLFSSLLRQDTGSHIDFPSDTLCQASI